MSEETWKSIPNGRFFENLFHGNFIYTHSFQCSVRKSPKEYFFIFCFVVDVWPEVLNRVFMSKKPAHRLLEYRDLLMPLCMECMEIIQISNKVFLNEFNPKYISLLNLNLIITVKDNGLQIVVYKEVIIVDAAIHNVTTLLFYSSKNGLHRWKPLFDEKEV